MCRWLARGYRKRCFRFKRITIICLHSYMVVMLYNFGKRFCSLFLYFKTNLKHAHLNIWLKVQSLYLLTVLYILTKQEHSCLSIKPKSRARNCHTTAIKEKKNVPLISNGPSGVTWRRPRGLPPFHVPNQGQQRFYTTKIAREPSIYERTLELAKGFRQNTRFKI